MVVDYLELVGSAKVAPDMRDRINEAAIPAREGGPTLLISSVRRENGKLGGWQEVGRVR